MTQETIAKIENRLQNATLPPKTREELLGLVAELKREVGRLPSERAEQGESITSFTDLSTFEATRTTKNQKSLEHSIGGLEASVSELEASHPELTGVVSRLANMLSNMGI